ncbi:hypothetical protein [Frisingicoccus sp.]|uniref:hypothetical protein n=1 Tax=Frisingicoccus sp. TaxID=1918627 RepID=UPI003AB50AE5
MSLKYKELGYMEYIIEIAAVLAASALAMILHELPKSIIYVLTGRHCEKKDKYRIFKLYRYVDPVGLILFLTCHAGCSRPYPYRLKEKDTNVAIGMTGFLSLGVMLIAGYAFYHMVLPRLPMILGMNPGDSGMIFLIQASWYFIYAVFVLFIVNLFPMISSDIFLIIVAISPKRLIPLMKNDTLIKGLLIVCIVLGGISALAVQGMNGMEQFLGFV